MVTGSQKIILNKGGNLVESYLKDFGFTPEDFGIQAMSRKSKIEKEDKNNDVLKCDYVARPSNRKFSNTKLDDLPLTIAYVPLQSLGTVYEQSEALKAGTLFPCLDKPFLGRKI